MTSASVVATLAQKELRALAPVFLATLALVPLCALGLEPGLMTIGVGVYVLGACALGALSIGHEFTHDTLGQLLALPGSRVRLLTVKLLVLGALLTILAAAANVTLRAWADSLVGAGTADALHWPVVVIPVLLSLCVAPVLTMIGKGALAGTVFTVAVYAGLWLLVPGITSPSFPWEVVDIQFYASAMLWTAAVISTVSAVAGVASFRRLESTGSHAAGGWISVRRVTADTARTPARAPRHPVNALLHKELRLQTVAFVVAGLYVAAWAAWALFTATLSHSQEMVYAFEGGTLFYQFILALLIGALASAEERSLGILQWQTLQPYAAWKQWTIKAATALTLTALLVVTLPGVLQGISADAVERFSLGFRLVSRLSLLIENGQMWAYVIVLLALTATGLFTSSLNRSSLHALLAAGLFSVISAVVIRFAFVAGTSAVWKGLDLNAFYYGINVQRRLREEYFSTWGMDDRLLNSRITLLVVAVAVVGFLLLLLSVGLKNHRSAETPRTVVTRQVATLLAYAVVASLVVGGGQPLLQYFLFTH